MKALINETNPLFQKSKTDESELIILVEKAWNCQLYPTPDYACIDAIAYRDNKLVAVMEMKSRNFGLEKVKKDYDNKLIARLDKFEKGKQLSALLQVPFLIVSYLTESKHIFFWKITDKSGFVAVNFEVEMMYVPTSIEKKSSAMRSNIKLDLCNAKEMKIETIHDHAPTENELIALNLLESDKHQYCLHTPKEAIQNDLVTLFQGRDNEKELKRLAK